MHASDPPTPLPPGLREWTIQSLTPEDVEDVLPHDDPIRAWWTPGSGPPRVEQPIDLLVGGQDILTLLALIHRAGCKSDSPRMPLPIERELAAYVSRHAARARTRVRGTAPQAILAYSHRDKERAALVGTLLRDAGLRVFQDADEIRPGDNILARLTDALVRTRSAVLLITRHYLRSEWTRREYGLLLDRFRTGRKTTHFLALFSSDYEQSGPCVRELDWAMGRPERVTIIPFLLDGRTKPHVKLEKYHHQSLTGDPARSAECVVQKLCGLL